ncbi:hypothetical protein BJ875DRAFT_498008 [Amylocarpus encephaloides]|uniref:non-specific serine/threonine protein kinase n=1 Tax=Amylocarpus encephaloides TaxID=45428 RepID=A0A9P8C389_9HELO|nr:hypothetical protein BJ875DRAFT_498008 [Amylocarpus encephaloides]
MSHLPPRSPTRRPPLGEATRRVNNTQRLQSTSMPHHESLKVDGQLQVHRLALPPPLAEDIHRTSSPVNPRLSAISKETDSKRNSQVSTVSTNASDGKRIKQTIGPWKLGRTLGKGATARVRLARHGYTGQEAAIKIVQKKNAQLSQAGSLAALDQESSFPDTKDGVRRMPVGIEREVAIMKLIQHPNIMKLYDIWENRTEIYLVLEFVDNGELFDHITAKGRLSEEEAMQYFRQILSAVGYCHSFNICHRDLKPENILLNKHGQIKIADFGMAALHQSPDHRLKTSCGSPHYAAPELIRGSTYRGDKVDIWSMGVILYATLAGRLPFDVDGTGRDWLAPLLSKIRKGSYKMAPEFSEDAANLIWRILQVNPRDRISLSQIWRHPVVRKYDYLDNLSLGGVPSPTAKECGRPVLRRGDINKELLRHMRSLWHRFTEEELMSALLSEDSNEQKLFYTLLSRYRETQLENYIPDLECSSSDYHHVRPQSLPKTFSTCNFSKVNSHGRQVSRFTVISNAAETEHSYDPFKASRPQHLNGHHSETAKVTIHRDTTRNASKTSIHSTTNRGRQRLAPPRGYASRSSIASSSKSRGSAPYVKALVGRKRGISFSHLRKPSGGSQKSIFSRDQPELGNSLANGQANGISSTTRYIRSRKGHKDVSEPLLSTPKAICGSQVWTEDVRELSSSLAKDCDEAFNRTSVDPSNKPATTENKLRRISLESRPLPPPPSASESTKFELLEYRKQAELGKLSGGVDSLGYLDRKLTHINRLIDPSSPSQEDRRAVSAPIEIRYRGPSRPLPSIHESRREHSSPRRSSGPKLSMIKRSTHNEVKASRVPSAPEPLHAGVKIGIHSDLGKIDEDHGIDYDEQFGHDSSSGTVIRKKLSWFRRNSRSGEVGLKSSEEGDSFPSHSPNKDTQDSYDKVLPVPEKGKGFSLRKLFKKRQTKTDMTVSPFDIYYDNADTQVSISEAQRTHVGRVSSYEDPRARQIEPQQNWLAKLFHVKPASKYICFSVNKRRARQEITTVLREWKRYGIRDVQVDKERNIVFGKVAAKNFLDMKEVSFAGEVMTVIEHGKRHHLSIARFTQERGAASSFAKVVETLESVLKCRGMLLSDERKKKRMIQTLNTM